MNLVTQGCCVCDPEAMIIRQNERMSIYDGVWGQMWAHNHMLLLFFPLHIRLSANQLYNV